MFSPPFTPQPFTNHKGSPAGEPLTSKPFLPMANPKRKQSKRRSANRRAANAFKAPEFAKDPTDGSAFRPHRVNPKNGMYRGRQVLNVEV
jgi:large subunit ribosomal protein L32